MLRKLLFSLTALTLACSPAWASGYNFITAEELHQKLTTQAQLTILDIQFEGAWKAGHFPESLATYAYPMKTDANKELIDAKLAELQKGPAPIVIVSTRGGSGAMRTVDHLKNKKIAAERLFILQNGLQAWPHKEMLKVIVDE